MLGCWCLISCDQIEQWLDFLWSLTARERMRKCLMVWICLPWEGKSCRLGRRRVLRRTPRKQPSGKPMLCCPSPTFATSSSLVILSWVELVESILTWSSRAWRSKGPWRLRGVTPACTAKPWASGPSLFQSFCGPGPTWPCTIPWGPDRAGGRPRKPPASWVPEWTFPWPTWSRLECSSRRRWFDPTFGDRTPSTKWTWSPPGWCQCVSTCTLVTPCTCRTLLPRPQVSWVEVCQTISSQPWKVQILSAELLHRGPQHQKPCPQFLPSTILRFVELYQQLVGLSLLQPLYPSFSWTQHPWMHSGWTVLLCGVVAR